MGGAANNTGGEGGDVWSQAVCTGGTAVFNVTTAADGAVGTTTLPPGLGYTQTRCFTCPLYTRTSTSVAGAVGTAGVGGVEVVKRMVVVVAAALVGL